jgi:hypothetical protein
MRVRARGSGRKTADLDSCQELGIDSSRRELQSAFARYLLSSAVQPWSRRLLERTKTADLVEAIEQIASSLLEASAAIQVDACPSVRLTRLAEKLRARVEVVHERKYLDTWSARSSPPPTWTRGRIRPADPQSWTITVTDAHRAYTRQSIAHELAHATLYTSESGIDQVLWRRTRWSLEEEATCAYMGRLLLAPTLHLLTMFSKGTNVAQTVVERIAPDFVISLRLACLRLLDVEQLTGSRVTAIIYWRQYHPLDDQYIVAASRNLACSHRLRAVATELRRYFRSTSHIEAEQIWTWILGGDSQRDEPAPQLGLPERGSKALESARRQLALLDRTEVELFREQSGSSNRSSRFRPEWALWPARPKGSFLPIRRGTARAGSAVARAAAATGACTSIETDDLMVGDLQGEYQSHIYAGGNSIRGTRYVLQVLRAGEG